MNEDLIQKFGFSEMYEWDYIPETINKIGRFVTFSKDQPEKINLFGESENDDVLGITTICSVVDSDNPTHWKYAYLCNEVGDVYLKKERLAVGNKLYDQFNEMNYIKTFPWEHYIQIPSEQYDKEKEYKRRTERPEWIRVNLMGKTIVFDNGECKAGEYCKPYVGRMKENWGSAVPGTKDDPNSFYVLRRMSKNTIIILNK